MNCWDKFWNWAIHARTDGAMVFRTLLEVGIGFVIANIDEICGCFELPTAIKGIIITGCPVMLSALLSCIRQCRDEKKTE